MTGWRIGYLLAPERLAVPIRRIHDFLTVGAAAPLQEAGAVALRLPPEYYADLLAGYAERRALVCAGLEAAGFQVYRPAGAYYVMTDVTALGGTDDVAFVRDMIERVGVAAVPGSSFYADPARGRTQVRFAFPKRRETLEAAMRRLAELRAHV
jgi:aminotransferase